MVGQILSKQYPHDLILEEIPIPHERLILDFFIPGMCLAVECQGRQHNEHVPFFHGDLRAFNESKSRDQRKKQWCELNNIKLLLIPYGTTNGAIKDILCGIES